MTPKPANYEIRQRPVWDPKPGTEHVWACLRTNSLAMHRLSDRVLGALTIAIHEGIIRPFQCNPNESDLKAGFEIRKVRYQISLGRGLLTPDGLGVVAIGVNHAGMKSFVLHGTDPANADLPVVPYNRETFKATYRNYADWCNRLIYKWSDNDNKTPIFVSYAEFPTNISVTVPADWPAGLTRDRKLASEISYRARKLNPETGKPIAVNTPRDVIPLAAVADSSIAAFPAAAPPIVANAPAPNSAPVPEASSAELPSDHALRGLSPAMVQRVPRASTASLHRAAQPIDLESFANQPQSELDIVLNNNIFPRNDLIVTTSSLLSHLTHDEILAALHRANGMRAAVRLPAIPMSSIAASIHRAFNDANSVGSPLIKSVTPVASSVGHRRLPKVSQLNTVPNTTEEPTAPDFHDDDDNFIDSDDFVDDDDFSPC